MLVYISKYSYSHFIYLKFVKIQEAKFKNIPKMDFQKSIFQTSYTCLSLT